MRPDPQTILETLFDFAYEVKDRQISEQIVALLVVLAEEVDDLQTELLELTREKHYDPRKKSEK